jgi:hypothetical protein
MSIQDLQIKLNEQKNRIGLVSGTAKVSEYDLTEHNVSARISTTDWGIEISVRKGFDPIQDKRQKAYAKKKKITDGLETVVLQVGGLHEPAHWELPFSSERGCPYDVYNHDRILEAVKTALPEDKKGQASYVVNAFEDMIINPRCKEWNGDFSGQVLFWDWEGLSAKEKGMPNYSPFYEAFVKLNMHLFGDGSDKALLKRHYTNDRKVDAAVKKVIKELSLPENIKDTSQLFRKSEWPNMAGIFARNLVDLLETSPTERLSAFSQNGSGDRQQDKQPAGNGIEQKMGTKQGKEDVAYGRYASGEERSPNITDYEQLDSLYRRLARGIPVEVEAITKEQTLPIGPLSLKPYDEERDLPSKIKASRLFATDAGLTFGVPAQQITIQHRSKVQRKSFPDFKLVVLDNSGSMAEGIDGNQGNTSFIPWGDRSKYHFALLGFYGIENFLQQQGVAQYISHGVSLFSSSTRYKEGQYTDIDQIRKFALAPEFGSTRLNASDLMKALNGRESFVLSISDGAIENWSSEKGNFKKLAENNYFAHIQLGGSTDFTRDLESWGLPVSYVHSGEDLSRLMVNTAKNTYRRFTSQ